MARIRTIKPEIWTDEKFVELSKDARLLFIGLWNFCDREGRVVYSPARIKMQIFPADAIDVVPLIQEMAAKGMVCVYESSNIRVLSIPNFKKHQILDPRERQSLLPASASVSTVSNLAYEDSLATHWQANEGREGKGRERKGKENTKAPGGAVVSLPEASARPAEEPPKPQFRLPEWISPEDWRDYEDMRRRIRKPMTDKAREWGVKKLQQLRARGHPPNAVLQQSVFNSWQGLFEPKGGATSERQTIQQRNQDTLRRVLEGDHQQVRPDAGD